MAVTNVDLNDLISTWRNKTNTISQHVGDVTALTTDVKSDTVGAINELETQANNFQVQLDNFDAGTDSATVLAIAQAAAIDGGKLVDLTVTNGKIANGTIQFGKFNNVQTLSLIDSAGVTIKTIYGAGA
jgi:hypothetical protein